METFYTVEHIIQNVYGNKPKRFESKSDAVTYAKLLDKLNNEYSDVKSEVRVYECKEISYK